MAAEASVFVENSIKEKPIVVFSKSYCPFCVKANNLFNDTLKVPADKINIIQLENRPDCADIQAKLKEITGASSVPRVFIQGKFIGGCDDTLNAYKSGELQKLIDQI